MMPLVSTKQHYLSHAREEEPDFCVSEYDFGIDFVILLHFSILSICHCSWVVMEDQRSVNCACI